MTPLASLLARIGWSQRQLAERIGCSESYIRKRERAGTVWPEVMAWLGRLATAHDREPPPRVQ